MEDIVREYQELNGPHIEFIPNAPTALEFSRIVHISRPVHFADGAICPLTPKLKWSDTYLIEMMGSTQINVAVTPDGLADSLVKGPDGQIYFVEPRTESMTMGSLLHRLHSPTEGSVICYLQSQNGNLYTSHRARSEFHSLRGDVPEDIPWATKAFGYSPDAVNLWIGNHQSTTSIHCDPYENIYTVVRGAKHFILFPPTEGYLLQERKYPRAVYTRLHPGAPLQLTPIDIDENSNELSMVSWASADPTKPIRGAMPLRVTIRAGETLYLPAGWWHHVTQSGDGPGGNGIVIAINWWYDMEMRGDKWVWLNALRRASQKGDQDSSIP